MATNYNGFKTSVRIGAVAILMLDGWSFSITQSAGEYVTLESTFANSFAGPKRWEGSCKGTLSSTATGQTSLVGILKSGGTVADVALRFYTSTGNVPYYSGNAVLTGMNVSAAVEDKVSVDFTFKGNGALTFTTTTS